MSAGWLSACAAADKLSTSQCTQMFTDVDLPGSVRCVDINKKDLGNMALDDEQEAFPSTSI